MSTLSSEGKMRRATSIIRKHRAAEKVYVSSNSRDNQYILAEMPLTDKLLELVVGDVDLTSKSPYQKFYQKLSKIAFEVIEKHGIEHANFVANSRLVRVRYNDEQQVIHTAQQSFFFYSPKHNSTFKGYFDGSKRSNKVKFLFLATGDELRVHSAEFHKKIYAAVQEISERIGLEPGDLKLKDHQHLTFDIYAKEKGNKGTITHTFREISDRYTRQGHPIEGDHTTITYAVVNIPMARRLLKGVDIDYDNSLPFEGFYQNFEKVFKDAAIKHDVKHAAMIANGLSPIVRYDETEKAILNGELISLGFNPHKEEGSIVCQWEGDKLVDNIRLVFFAVNADETNNTYGKFANQVIDATKSLTEQLNWKKSKDEVVMRLHQHIVRKV
jgi:hypothetical protein